MSSQTFYLDMLAHLKRTRWKCSPAKKLACLSANWLGDITTVMLGWLHINPSKSWTLRSKFEFLWRHIPRSWSLGQTLPTHGISLGGMGGSSAARKVSILCHLGTSTNVIGKALSFIFVGFFQVFFCILNIIYTCSPNTHFFLLFYMFEMPLNTSFCGISPSKTCDELFSLRCKLWRLICSSLQCVQEIKFMIRRSFTDYKWKGHAKI